jgi:sugar fermentation stimulation protein A
MQFEAPLERALLIKRYKRFLADVTLADGREVTAHCPNPGAMTGLADPGMTVGLLPSINPKAKLSHRWELSHADGAWVGINTGRPNRLAEEAIREGLIEPLASYATIRREVRYGQNSRIDLLLESPDRPACYVEVKNVHLMRQPGLAEFPDCVTARGAKHLAELTAMAATGMRAVMLFVVQRSDCKSLSLAQDIDPGYAAAMQFARAAGVEVFCYGCTVTEDRVILANSMPFAQAVGQTTGPRKKDPV